MSSVGFLISIAVILQAIESFWIRPFPWNAVQSEMPRILRSLLAKPQWINAIRLVSAMAALVFPHPVLIALMWLATWGMAIRFRGTFNGGSDSMTFHILAAWLVAAVNPEFQKAALFYVAVFVALSYFVAGISKLRQADWRNGAALKTFLGRRGFQISPTMAFVAGWMLMLFEILFPLVFQMPMTFIGLAIVFHILNVYIFGLNRFFFAWLAGYPAIIFVARHI